MPVNPSALTRNGIRTLVEDYFCGSDGQPFRLEKFHVEILEAMFKGGYLVVNVPTDHAKSTLGTFLYPLLSLMENPDETHIICGANINDSKRRVQALELELETNERLIQDFPWLAKPKTKDSRIWSATQFNVSGRTVNKPNPSVLASAVGSNDLKGRRGKLIMDDIEGEDARWSPVKREQLYSWLKLEAWRCFEDRRESPRPLLCMLGTPFDVDSIYFSVERQGWKVIRYPVYKWEQKNVPLIRKDGKVSHQRQTEYLWPDKKEKVDRARASLRKLEFAVAYLMDPTGGDASRISSAEIVERMQQAERPEEAVGFISLDPASGGQGPKADYAGIAVCRIYWPQGDELPKVEVAECHNFTQGLFEQVHFCAHLHAVYGYPVIYEGNSQQGNVYQQTFGHLHPNVPLIRHYTSHQNKFDNSMGLTVVKRMVVDRKLYVSPSQLDSEGMEHLVQEIRDLQPPFKLHNHIAMAIWFCIRHAYEKVRAWKGPTIKTAYGAGAGPYFGGRPMVSAYQYGYRVNPMEQQARQAREQEEILFREALQRRRSG